MYGIQSNNLKEFFIPTFSTNKEIVKAGASFLVVLNMYLNNDFFVIIIVYDLTYVMCHFI